MSYSSAQLKEMDRMQLRQVARRAGVPSDKMFQKKPNEMIRLILTAQQPGGIDARINPKGAAEARKKLAAKESAPPRVVKAPQKPPAPRPSAQEVFNAPAAPRPSAATQETVRMIEPQPPRGVMPLEQVPRLVAELKSQMEALTAKVNSLATLVLEQPQSAADPAVMPRQRFTKVAVSDIKTAQTDDLFAINDFLRSQGKPSADLSDPYYKSNIGALKGVIIEALMKSGGTVEAGEGAQGELVDDEPFVPTPDPDGGPIDRYPPEQPGDQFQLYSDEAKSWLPAVLIELSDHKDEDGNLMYFADAPMPDGYDYKFEVDLKNMRPYPPQE